MCIAEGAVHGRAGALDDTLNYIVPIQDRSTKTFVAQHFVEGAAMFKRQQQVLYALFDIPDSKIKVGGGILGEAVHLIYVALQDADHLILRLCQILVQQVYAE